MTLKPFSGKTTILTTNYALLRKWPTKVPAKNILFRQYQNNEKHPNDGQIFLGSQIQAPKDPSGTVRFADTLVSTGTKYACNLKSKLEFSNNKQFIVNDTMKKMVMRRPSWSTGRLCCSRSESGKLVRSDGGGAGLLGDATSVMHQN